MSADEPAHWIVPTRGAKTLPTVEILTGRGFVTGKSGSGKSNTASVIAEELLENGYTIVVIDTEGEYYGLKERYDLLHVGADEACDAQVGPEDAPRLAEAALTENVPLIVDVSDYLDGEESRALIAAVVEELYRQEKEVRKPVLLMVEEMQEYLPQTGGQTDLGVLLERVAKRGRKRGLGMLGISQRPSSVDKDFITQCDWMVWHRLTWQNDIDVVRKVLGSETADEVEGLDTGEAFLMTDWDDSVEQVQFKRKRTHDAGATPGLDRYEHQNGADDGIRADENGHDAENRSEGSEPSTITTAETTADAADSGQRELTLEEAGSSPDARSANGSGREDDTAAADLDAEVSRLRNEAEELPTPSESGGRIVDATVDSEPWPRHVESERSAARADSATRPAPPPEPPSRSNGVGASDLLVEFAAMVVYLLRLASYRLRLAVYRLRTDRDDRRR